MLPLSPALPEDQSTVKLHYNSNSMGPLVAVRYYHKIVVTVNIYVVK